MAPHFGYIRVSSLDQNENRQLADIRDTLDKVFIDKLSGKDTQRPSLQQMLEFVREGDTVHAHSIDRLARNLRDLQAIVDSLINRGVSVIFHKENLTFSGGDDPMQKLTLQLMGAFSEFERSIIKERQREGIEAAKQRGVYRGRKPKLRKDQIDEIEAKLAAGATKKAIAEEYGVSRQTLYAALARD
jgi:DNA invertase Pin-like site-specific DNA recombinase